jgi:multidrug efflux pump subunit AcrA (membrane-fusion protein)
MIGKKARLAAILVLIPSAGALSAFTLPGIIPGIKTPPALPGAVALVSQGAITSTTTPSGLTQDVAQFSLNFDGTGTVKSVKITQGQQVKANQVLAVITSPTYDNQLITDQNAVTNAGAALAKLIAPPTAASLTQAKATLATAQSKLAAMQAGGTPASIAEAQASLDSANSKLAALEKGTPSSVASAQANLD